MMPKVLFHSRAIDHEVSDLIYLRGYRTPFRVIAKKSNEITIRHCKTGQIRRLSPGWKTMHENKEHCEILGL